MPRLRTPPDRQHEAAIEELVTLASSMRGLHIVRSAEDHVNVTVGQHSWPAKVIARDAVSLRDAQHLVENEARGSKIVVANQVSTEAKDFLAERNEANRTFGWSWLDRRGELVLNHPKASGVIQFDLDAIDRNPARPGGWGLASPRSSGAIRGRAGMSYAAAVLLDPTERPSIRAVAEQAGMSHGAIGEAAKLMRDAGLIRRNGEPEIPDLFDALADAWGPTLIAPVDTVPTREDADRLRANVDDLSDLGWGLGGDEAALSWGAPMFLSGFRPWIWVPTEADARRATRALQPAKWDDSRVVFAVAPTLLVSRTRVPSPGIAEPAFIPTVHPLFLALDLARDPGRGREILDGWNPKQPEIHRVW
ncbi:MAG: hypothetical protein JJE52_01855 [Acidimicrobiia bacterium]|nr:hypothetical protein [Acidimicrobiia bacterium]